MAVGVVDGLEVVEVADRERQRAPVADGPADFARQVFVHVPAVVAPGEGVPLGQVADLLVGFFQGIVFAPQPVVEQRVFHDERALPGEDREQAQVFLGHQAFLERGEHHDHPQRALRRGER